VSVLIKYHFHLQDVIAENANSSSGCSYLGSLDDMATSRNNPMEQHILDTNAGKQLS
jgi:hypothetical protein